MREPSVVSNPFQENTTRILEHRVPAAEVMRAQEEEKDDHGNESYSPTVSGKILEQGKETTELKSFVDHTTAAKGLPQFKVFTDASADHLTKEGNDWIKEHPEYNVKLIGQLQFDNGMFAIALYYEETKQ